MCEINYCPKCGRQLERANYYDERRLVEWNYSCSCGYVVGYSYGSYYEENAEEEEEEQEETEEEWKKIIDKLRKMEVGY